MAEQLTPRVLPDDRAAGMGPVFARDRRRRGAVVPLPWWMVSTQPGAQPVDVGEDLAAQRPLALPPRPGARLE